jgi:flagellar hook-associated protein 2
MAITLTGMASGLDTDSIIQQLMQVDQLKITAVQNQSGGVSAHQSALKSIQAKLDAFKSAAAALSDSATWKASQSVGSSDSSKVDVALTSGAGIGGHTIAVDKLASSAQHGFSYQAGTAAGKLTFYYGADPAATGASKVDIDVPANATPADVATAVNANENSPVYAAVVNDGTADRLVFSARKTGINSNFTVDTSALGTGAAMGELGSYQRIGTQLNAQYRIDDDPTQIPSETNTVANAIPGLTLTLKGVTTSAVSVTTNAASIDPTAITKKVQALVDAYNSVVTTTRGELTEKPVVKKSSSSDYTQGTLFGDTGVDGMLSQLKSAMTQTVSGLGLGSLADLGITIPKSTGTTPTQDAKDGKLSFDSSVLTKALTTDYTKVRDLFTGKGTTKGFAGLLGDFVDAQDGTHGILTGRVASDDTSIKDYTDQVTNLTSRMDDEQTRLKAQFAAMETALNTAQSQQAWLTSQIASLPTYG